MTQSPFSDSPFAASPQQPSGGFWDIGFTRFISNTWISVVWVVVIVAHFLAALSALGCGIALTSLVESPVPFLVALLIVLLGTPLSLLFCRIALELEVIFFRIESNTRETKEYLREIKEQLGKK